MKSKNPMEIFFSLGDKITKGDAKRKADFDYYLLWVMFVAFLTILISNFIDFIKNMDFAKLGWALVMFAVVWFQYYNLKMAREARKLSKSNPKKEDDDKIDDFKSMINNFDGNIPGEQKENLTRFSSPLQDKTESKSFLEKFDDIPNIFTLNIIERRNDAQ